MSLSASVPPARSCVPRAIVGTSAIGFSDATDHAIARAFETCPSLTWYTVQRLSGCFRAGQILLWEVSLAVGTDSDAEERPCVPRR